MIAKMLAALKELDPFTRFLAWAFIVIGGTLTGALILFFGFGCVIGPIYEAFNGLAR